MNAEQLEELVDDTLPNVKAAIQDIEDKVLRAAADVLEASQDEDAGGDPSITITVAIKVPLSVRPMITKTKAKVSASYSSKEFLATLDDPDQPELAEDFGKGRRPRRGGDA